MTHPELVVKLVKPGKQIVYETTPYKAHLIHMALGISGEAGELLDVLKKHTMYNQPLDVHHLTEELGDLEFYLESLRQAVNITREATLAHNIEKLSIRYSLGKYSNEAAKDRADKQ